jgi:hypothetical protein
MSVKLVDNIDVTYLQFTSTKVQRIAAAFLLATTNSRLYQI